MPQLLLRWMRVVCVGGGVGIAAASIADPIPPAYRAIASAGGVPAEVLFVVALKESGVRLDAGRVVPWPWTLNIAGKPHRYASRVQAHAGLLAALDDGRWVDVGLGQISWQYHTERLRDPWSALDPLFNLQIAAALLRQAYESGDGQDWWAAAGRYHSPGKRPAQRQRAERYAEDARLRHRRLFGAVPPNLPARSTR